MYGSLTFSHRVISQFLMADIFFDIACKELKIAQTAALSTFDEFILVFIFGHGFHVWVKSYNNGENVTT